ncbi:MAG: hypothetical protein NTY35_16195 [Planctomycetota bacterium]|nr:hypothetical protein [Planctomycetota bacterium]
MLRIPKGLLLAVVVYVVLRALIVTTSFEDVALPMYELYPMGTMAELSLRGIDFPLRYFYDNAAGQILMGFLTVPVFATFGSSYLALKILPALLGLSTLILVWHIVDRHFSRRAANFAGLLFAVGPPTLTKYSLINSGNHFENLFFTSVALCCAYSWFASVWKTRAGLFGYAFACGFALFVFLGALIPVGILFGMHAGLRGARRTLRDLPVFVAGFALGLSPLLLVNISTGGRGLGFLDAKFGSDNSGRGGDVLARVGEFLGPALARSPVFEPFAGLSRELLTALFLAAFALAYLASLPRTGASLVQFARTLLGPAPSPGEEARRFEASKFVPFVLYVPLAALAFGVSNFRLGGHAAPVEVAGYRYFLPTLLFALVLVAVWADRWIARGGIAKYAGYALLSAAAIPGASSLGIVDWTFSATGVGSKLDGYNLAQMARALVSTRNAVPKDEIVARIDALPDDVRPRVIQALGFNLGVQAAEKSLARGATLDLPEFLAPWPPAWHEALTTGLANGLRWQARIRHAPIDAAFADSERVANANDTQRNWIESGLARPGVALPVPWDTESVVAENADWIARHGADSPAFVRGDALLRRALLQRGIESDRALFEHSGAEGRAGQ